MRKRRLFLLILAVVVLVGWLVVLSRREREPEYQGKRLSRLIAVYLGDTAPLPPVWEQQEAATAIRSIGAEAIPWLVSWMHYETPAWRAKASSFIEDTVEKIDSRWQFSPEDSKETRANTASYAFKALGPKAESAVPELTRMLNEADRPDRQLRAVTALAGIGAAGLPPLLSVLTNRTNNLLPSHAAYCIGGMGAEARPAVPLLVQCLRAKPRMVGHHAAIALGVLKMEPDMVVPALTEALQSGELTCRVAAASSLGRFGSNATSAVSALVSLLEDPVSRMRTAATNALRKIDPQALEGGRRGE